MVNISILGGCKMIKTLRKKLLASIMSIAMLISFMPAMTLTVNAAEPEPYTATATVNDSLPLLVSELSGLDNLSEIISSAVCVQGYTQPSSGYNIAKLYFVDPDLTTGAGEVEYLDTIDHAPDDTVESEDETIYFKANTAGEYTFYIRIYDYDTIDVRRKITVTVTDGDTTKPTLTAGAVNRTSDTEATVKFTSNEAGSYYYEVVEDNASNNIDTNGDGTPCTTDEVTITNPTGLTSGTKDIYIIVKDGAGNESTPLKIDIDAYSSGNSAMFDFESNTAPIADNSAGTALETVTQEVNSETISIASTGGKFVIGDEIPIIGADFSGFDGKVMAFDGLGSAYSTKIRVSLQSGYSFNLNTFGVLDNYLPDHNPNPIILVSSKGASYNVGSQISYGSDDNGVASIDVSSVSGFDNITYFDFYANGSPMQLALDNIYLTNITALPTLSNDATLKSSSTVKGQEVTSLGTPNATLGSESAGAVTITAAQAADTSNAGSYITLFDQNESHAAMKVVKYASGDSTTDFETDTAYDNEAITDGDFFVIKVTAQNTTTENFYKIIVTVIPAPTATVQPITGIFRVGATLTGHYTYSGNGTNEGTSTFKWYRADDSSGTNKTEIAGETGITYVLQSADVGKYVSFEVTPVTTAGTQGTAVLSAWVGEIVLAEAAPTATVQAITGTLQVGETLAGNYTYSDVNGDSEGTSTFKWYRADNVSGLNKTEISGETAITYVLQSADTGKYIGFEVTPVASTGTAQGTAVESERVGPIVGDTTAPTGYSVMIDQAAINNGNKDAMSFTFSVAEVGATYNYVVSSSGGGSVTVSGTVTDATQQITGIDISSLSDGTLTLSVTLTDTAGNIGASATDTVVKDTTAPTGYSLAIDQTAINNSNKNAMSFTFGGAEVGTAYNYVVSSSGGGSVTGSGTVTNATEQITAIDISSLSDGTLTLSATLTDTAGNVGTAATDTVSKDTTAPTGYSVNIDQTAINNSNKTAMSFTFGGAEVGATYNYVVSSSGGGSVTGSGTLTNATEQITGIDISTLGDGTLTLSVTLADAAGNTGTFATDTVVKDTIVEAAPTATVQAITGTLQAGQTLTGHYTYSDINGDLEGTSTFKWYRSDNEAGLNKVAIEGATLTSYVLQSTDVGKYISFEVTPVAATGTAQGTAVESDRVGAIILADVAPTATVQPITGTLQVGQTLTGHYTYSDVNSDLEGVSTYKWYRSDDGTGLNKTVIAGETAITHELTSADIGKYISFEVTPVAATGIAQGTAVESDGVGAIILADAAPTATVQPITGTLQVGQTLTGHYTYSDVNSDLEGVSTYKWYRSNDGAGLNKTVIAGETAITYELTSADIGKYISFEVTPVAEIGIAQGTAVESDGVGAILLADAAPTATVQPITGTLQVGQTLAGHYTYSDVNGDLEGTSAFKWYRSDDATGLNKAAIAGATSTTYVLQSADIGKYISLEVTPVAATGTAQGTAVESAKSGPVAPISSVGSSGGSSSTTTQPGQGTSQNTVVVVNGKEQNAGKETQATENGKSTVTVAVDSKAVESKIDDAIKNNTTGIGNVIQVPVADTKSEVAKVELTGDIVKKLEENTFDVSVKRDNVEYVIPAEEFTISKVAENLGLKEKKLADIKVEVKIAKLDKKVVEKYNEVAKANGAELVFPPVEFEIVAKTIKTDGTTKEQSINKFSNYVERVMKIPAGVDPSKITTGIVFNADGTYSHVPTEVYQKDGKWYAKLNSLTNSDYSVIWNPVTVKSVENHWAKDAVNDMASRLVIINPEEFEPNKAITRADFAEYIVRALGLYREGATHENNFKDVSAKGERTLAILIANEYGIVSGYSDGTFRGDNQITREEAMVVYQRAMGITKLVGSDENRYQSYTDYSQVSDWAKTNVKNVLAAHVFNGTTATKISPKANLTYAEAAQAIRNLLIESKLISE